MIIRLTFCSLILLGTITTYAQDLTEKNSLKVFLDCHFCNDNYIKSNLQYIDYVRDKELADVHILATRVRSGVANSTYIFDFIGLKDFKNQDYKITCEDEPNSTKQFRNDLFTKKIEIGLVPYWIQTKMANNLSLKVKSKSKRFQDEVEEKDPWNSWVFSIEGGGSGKLETSKYDLTFWGRFKANKVTELWRIRNLIHLRTEQRQFKKGPDVIFRVSESNNASTNIVRSINNHFSTGIHASIVNSTYGNLRLGTTISPAFEYSLFPYQEVNRREITVAYRINQLYREYEERTIYDKMEENLWSQSLVFSARFQQPWGSLHTEVQGSHFLHDFQQNRLEITNRLNLRVAKGLSLTINGNFDIIHDQRSLPAGGTSLEDLLLAQRQIATNFRLSGNIGVKYSFGSAFANVVNTRL